MMVLCSTPVRTGAFWSDLLVYVWRFSNLPVYYCSKFRLSHLVFLNCFSEMLTFLLCTQKKKKKLPPRGLSWSHFSHSGAARLHSGSLICRMPTSLPHCALGGGLPPAVVVALVTPDTFWWKGKPLQIGTNYASLCHCTGVTKLCCFFIYAPFAKHLTLSPPLKEYLDFFPQTFLPYIYHRKKLFARQYVIICYMKNQVYGFWVTKS